MTDMTDIYRAAGATVNEDGSVKITEALESFDIVLRVFPVGYEIESGRKPMIKFAIDLHDELIVHPPMVTMLEHDVQLTLPVDQVRIAEKTRP